MSSNSNSSNKKSSKITPSHGHGGQLTQASKEYNIPLEDWLDLSTGISPFIYPLPNIPSKYWQRLPETNDGLETAAKNYYGSDSLLPVSGSQEAIQRLPYLFESPLKIGLITPAYHSHQQAWENAGHHIVLLQHDEIETALSSIDILLLVNPTNPSCHTYHPTDLRKWHHQLTMKKGYLIVDEAFMDCTPENSLIEETPQKGLIVLRSIGKFFGLAGIRLGFVWAENEILEKLLERQDDWSVSNPARWAGKMALEDLAWQKQQRDQLNQLGLRLSQLLSDFLNSYNSKIIAKSGEVSLPKEGSHSPKNLIKHTDLFAYFEHFDALSIHQQLARQGILIRLFTENNQSNALRFGLPENESEWIRLKNALTQVSHYSYSS